MLLTLAYLAFAAISLLLIVVILIQEGKGGGLGGAFGGAGQQVFGSGASGIAKFTGYLAGGMLVLAVVITLREKSAQEGLKDQLGLDFGVGPAPAVEQLPDSGE